MMLDLSYYVPVACIVRFVTPNDDEPIAGFGIARPHEVVRRIVV